MPFLEPDTRILTIPGLDNSGPSHWQSLWEHQFDTCERVELGQWNAPDRDLWVSRISETIAGLSGPVLIAAHSLGCHAFTKWFEQAPSIDQSKITGALLVAPPDLSNLNHLSRVSGFNTVAQFSSRVPMIVVGSDDDPYAKTAHVWRLACKWGARFINAGPFGHINADSNLADWPYGQYLLASLQSVSTSTLTTDRSHSAAAVWPNRPRSRENNFEFQESIHRP